jgi:antitoxin component YwqK of YwqJK toxin-antitoxin module
LKYVLTIILLIIAPKSLFAQDTIFYHSGAVKQIISEKDQLQKVVQYYENGQKHIAYSLLNGKKHGNYKRWSAEGELTTRIEYDHGLYSGPYIFYLNGNVYKLITYKVVEKEHRLISIKEGKYELYYNNGELQEKGEYENDEKHGKWRTYYEDGSLKTKEEYEFGVKTGTYKFYDNKGVLRVNENYTVVPYGEKLVSKKHGKCKRYYENGVLWVAEEYKEGKKINDDITYFKNGALYLLRSYDDEGNIFGLQQKFNEDGSVLYSYNIIATSPKYQYDGAYILSHNNGQVRINGNYKNGLRHGKWVEYYENGNIVFSMVFKNDMFTENLLKFFITGDTMLYEPYKQFSLNGRDTVLKHGVYREFRMRGDSSTYLVSKGNYNKGKKNGVFRSWYSNGQLAELATYKNDVLYGEKLTYYEEGGLKLKVVYLLAKNGENIGRTEYHYHYNGQLRHVRRYLEPIIEYEHLEEIYNDEGAPVANTVHFERYVDLFIYFHPNGMIKEMPYFKFYPNGALSSYKQQHRDSMVYYELYFDPMGKLVDGRAHLNHKVIAKNLKPKTIDSLANIYNGIFADTIDTDAENATWRFEIENEISIELNFTNGRLDSNISFKTNYGYTQLYINNGYLDGKQIYNYTDRDVKKVAYYENAVLIDSSVTYRGDEVWEIKWNDHSFEKPVYAWYKLNNDGTQSYENFKTNVKKNWYANGQLSYKLAPSKAYPWWYVSKSWYENGAIKSKGFKLIKYNKDHDEWCDTSWFENGEIQQIKCIKNGMEHGSFYYVYNEGHKITGTYKEGKQNGIWRRYDTLGNLYAEELYEMGALQATASGVPCECLNNDLVRPKYVPRVLNRFTLEEVNKAKYDFHAPVGNWYNRLFMRNYYESQLNALALDEPYLLIPDSNGLKLILNACITGNGLSETEVHWYKQGDHLIINAYPEQVAIEFDHELLVVYNEVSKSAFLKEGEPMACRLSFDPEKVSYSKDGIVFNTIKDPCFTPALIGETRAVLKLNEFKVNLNGEPFCPFVGPLYNIDIKGDDAKKKVSQWLVNNENNELPRIWAMNGSLLLSIANGKQIIAKVHYGRFYTHALSLVVEIDTNELPRKYGVKDLLKELEKSGFNVQDSYENEDGHLFIQLNYKKA